MSCSAGLKLAAALREELHTSRAKINVTTRHDAYEHWRASDKDDLVLSLAIAAWWAEYRGVCTIGAAMINF